MAYSKETILAVKADYARKWERAAAAADARRTEVELALPRVREIDRELSGTAPLVMRAALSGEGWETAFAEIKAHNLALQAEKTKLLEDAGFPADYTDIRYECPECKDTGYVGSTMCRCMKREMARREYEASGLGHLMETQSFATFDLSYYTGADGAAMERNCRALRQFAEHFTGRGDPSWLLLGGTGLGKTHLSTAVAKVLIDRGFGVSYVTAQDLIAAYRKSSFGDEQKDPTESLLTADLLIIDDLGTELSTAFTVSCVYSILNARLSAGRSTLVSTNLSQAELRERYADRITSRLFGEFYPLLFSGRDVRAQKLSRNVK